MTTDVIMPKQGLQMTEGLITKWLVQEGERIEAGAPLFEMETDKLTIEIESPASGILLKIIRPAGETVPITELVAQIGESSDAAAEPGPADSATAVQAPPAPAPAVTAAAAPVPADLAPASQMAPAVQAPAGRIFTTPRARTAAAEHAVDPAGLAGSGPDGLIIERDILAAARRQPAEAKITPVAARLARQNAVDPNLATGSGARGKIVRADIEDLVAAKAAGPSAAPGPSAVPLVVPSAMPSAVTPDVPSIAAGAAGPAVQAGQDKLIPFAGMRKVIADRMMQSVQGMAQANHRMKVDMSEIVRFREKLKEAEVKVSYSDILIKVVARALADFPMINASLTPEGILLKSAIHIGLAVAVENGLIVPVIKHADRRTLREIAAASASLAEKARKGGLLPDDYTGGTFTITNLGMYDLDSFTAIVNPPESAILAIGKIDRVPVAVEDTVVIRPVMMLSLSYDHRIIDGAPAAQFLQRIKQYLQNPYLLF